MGDYPSLTLRSTHPYPSLYKAGLTRRLPTYARRPGASAQTFLTMSLHPTPSSAILEEHITDLKETEREDETEAAAKEAEALRARAQAQRSTRNRERAEKMIAWLKERDQQLVEDKRKISELQADLTRVSGERDRKSAELASNTKTLATVNGKLARVKAAVSADAVEKTKPKGKVSISKLLETDEECSDPENFPVSKRMKRG